MQFLRTSRVIELAKNRVFLLSVTVCLLSGFTLWYLLSSDKDAHLRKFEALKNIGDTEAGILELKQHIVQNPNDLWSRLTLAEQFEEIDSNRASRSVLWEVVRDSRASLEDSVINNTAMLSLRVNLDQSLSRVVSDLERAYASYNHELILDIMPQSVELLKEYKQIYYLDRNQEDSITLSLNEMQFAEFKGFALWMQKDLQGLANIEWFDQTYTFRLTPDASTFRRKEVSKGISKRIGQYAGKKHSESNYEEAAEAWSAAKEQWLEAIGPTWDEEAARLQYNQALAEYGRHRSDDGLKLLKEVRTKFPGYREKVDAFLGKL